MKYSKEVIVVVDAYTSGKYIAPGIIANGYDCVHVQSREKVISAYIPTYFSENFIENIIFDGNLDTVIEKLSQYRVMAVIPGAETGVMLADKINHALCHPYTNPIQLSAARRNKLIMQQALANAGVEHAHFSFCHDIEVALSWSKAFGFPIVIKALESSGSHGVYICRDEEELRLAFCKVAQEGTVFGDAVQEVLLQEFLSGQEYIVNTVSFHGKHKIIDVWKKHKKTFNGHPINLYSDLIDSHDDEYSLIINYIEKVLDALEIRYGAAHSEVMLTARGPLLIETAARLAGSIDPSAVIAGMGTNQVLELIKSYIEKDSYDTTNCEIKKCPIRHVFLSSKVEGLVVDEPSNDGFKRLGSLHSFLCNLKRGKYLQKTTTLANFPGYAYLTANSQHEIEKDYQTFREVEDRFYKQAIYNEKLYS